MMRPDDLQLKIEHLEKVVADQQLKIEQLEAVAVELRELERVWKRWVRDFRAAIVTSAKAQVSLPPLPYLDGDEEP